LTNTLTTTTQIFDQGYYSVVCVGGDLPTTSPEFVQPAFRLLFYLSEKSDRGAMVLVPCQAAGVSLVRLTTEAPMDFTGVFYNIRGIAALEAITSITSARQIPMALLDPLKDVDYQDDLAHNCCNRCDGLCQLFPARCQCAQRTVSLLQQIGLTVCTSPDEELRGDMND
jgi:glycosyltransferase A (GT-A) superfamily protein (DUF2064 family)